jgi:hypothetical protein
METVGTRGGRDEPGPVVTRSAELAHFEVGLHRQLERLSGAGGDRHLEGVGEVGDRLVLGVAKQQDDAVLLTSVGGFVAKADHEVVLADRPLLMGRGRAGQ